MKLLCALLLLASCVADEPRRAEGVSQEDWGLRRGRDAFGYELKLAEDELGVMRILEVVAPRLAGSSRDSEVWQIDLERNEVLGTRSLAAGERFPDAMQFRLQKPAVGGTSACCL